MSPRIGEPRRGRVFGNKPRFFAGMWILLEAAVRSTEMFPRAYTRHWNYPWEANESITSVLLLVGPLPIAEFIASILGALFVMRFKAFSDGYDRGLFIGGVTVLVLRSLMIWYAYMVMVEGGTFRPREDGEPLLCEVTSCVPLYFGMFVQCLPALTKEHWQQR